MLPHTQEELLISSQNPFWAIRSCQTGVWAWREGALPAEERLPDRKAPSSHPPFWPLGRAGESYDLRSQGRAGRGALIKSRRQSRRLVLSWFRVCMTWEACGNDIITQLQRNVTWTPLGYHTWEDTSSSRRLTRLGDGGTRRGSFDLISSLITIPSSNSKLFRLLLLLPGRRLLLQPKPKKKKIK